MKAEYNWYKSNVLNQAHDSFQLKYLEGERGDFGELYGVQFESELVGGYVYFWTGGVVQLFAYNYELDADIIGDSYFESPESSLERLSRIADVIILRKTHFKDFNEK